MQELMKVNKPTALDFLAEEPGTPKVNIYTDGACSGNPGPGGYGAVIMVGDLIDDLYGGEPSTTNNRMEMMAVIEALAALPKSCEINLYVDSMYVKDGINAWMKNWKKNGWHTTAGKPVKNQDLWMRLDELTQKHIIHWHWVKGHDGNEYNERADSLARSAVVSQKLKLPC